MMNHIGGIVRSFTPLADRTGVSLCYNAQSTL